MAAMDEPTPDAAPTPAERLAARSGRFPCYFERRVVRVPADGGEVAVPAHLYAAFWHGRDHWQRLPIVGLVGGPAVGKAELHRLAIATTITGNFLAVTVDLPGTGETPDHPAADVLLAAVLRDYARDLGGERPFAVVGVGPGGAVAARLAATGVVAAAVDLGGASDVAPGAPVLVVPEGPGRRVTPAVIAWLRLRLHGASPLRHVAERLTRTMLPRRR